MAPTTLEALAAALPNVGRPAEITAPKAHAAHLVRQAERLTYAEARPDLDARARAGETKQGRDNRGCFTRGVKVFTTATAPVVQVAARKVEKVAEVRRLVATVERRAPASAPSFAIAAE